MLLLYRYVQCTTLLRVMAGMHALPLGRRILAVTVGCDNTISECVPVSTDVQPLSLCRRAAHCDVIPSLQTPGSCLLLHGGKLWQQPPRRLPRHLQGGLYQAVSS